MVVYMYTSAHSYFTENMPKSSGASRSVESEDMMAASADARMRLYEIFVAAGLAGRTRTIAEVAALGGIAEDEPVIRTYRTVNLRFDPESQSMREDSAIVAGGVIGGRAADKKTLVIQL